MRRSSFSVIISLTLHIVAFIIFAGVKLYREPDVADQVSVAFVGAEKTRLMRRSIPVRPMISLDKTARRQAPEQYAIVQQRRASVDFYVSAPEKVFSQIGGIDQNVFRDMGVQKPVLEQSGQVHRPMSTDLLNEPHLRGIQIKPRIAAGRDLLEDFVPAYAKPNIAGFDALQRFSEAVRKRIESKKRYPLAAQKVGLEGRTGIRMIIMKNGQLENVEIVDSSGNEMLDRAAVQSVRDADPFPPIPDETGMSSIEMSIYLVFKISS